VAVIATAHGFGIDDVEARLGECRKFFDKYVILSRRNGVGTIEEIGG
jgi:stage III sporulation protein SpoIIIAA